MIDDKLQLKWYEMSRKIISITIKFKLYKGSLWYL